jgi:hypothetical protein
MSMKIRKVKRSTLIIGIIVELIFSIVMGVTAGARGLGSLYPQLNLVARPFLCPDRQMSYTQQVSEIGSATYWSASWFCVDAQSDTRTELDPNMVFLYVSPVYSFVFFAVLMLITYVYWNSSVGPAKNDGLELW